MVLRSGGQVDKVSAYFRDTFSSPKLTPFMDWLPLPSQIPTLTQVSAFADLADYVKPFVGANTKYYGIKARERRVKFHSQLSVTDVWGYVDNAKPDPPEGGNLFAFRMPRVVTGQGPRAGILIRHFNDPFTGLPEGRPFGVPTTTVHFHGGHQPALADGFPDNIRVPPAPAGFDRVVFGGFNEFRKPNPGHYDFCHPLRDVGFSIDGVGTPDDRPAFLWFHDHILDFTGPNAYRGLANVCPVFDDFDTGNETDYLTAGSPALGLPSGDYDIPLVFQDKIFDVDGSLIFSTFDHDGFIGDRFVVNGLVQPKLEVKRRKYRFRFLNASNARIYQFFLTNRNGKTFPMTQIATEGGLLSEPWRGLDGQGVRSFMLAMAERAEVVVDFGDDSMFGSENEIFIENRLVQTDGRKPDDLVSSGTRIVQLLLTNHIPDPSRVPAVLRRRASVTDAMINAATFPSFRSDRSHGGWTINGELVNLERPLAKVQLSTGRPGTSASTP
jgi:FtsP/CotA-like multicopper oxidase with cupredoxin domain